jgi:hypothetical protein
MVALPPISARPKWVPGAGAPASSNSYPRTPYDALPLPGGRQLGDVPGAELAAILIELKVPTASHENGRAINAAAYGQFIEALKAEAASRAVQAWLEGKA